MIELSQHSRSMIYQGCRFSKSNFFLTLDRHKENNLKTPGSTNADGSAVPLTEESVPNM